MAFDSISTRLTLSTVFRKYSTFENLEVSEFLGGEPIGGAGGGGGRGVR